MEVKIKRYLVEPEEKEFFQSYKVELENPTLLELLQDIKTSQDSSLSFSSGCRSSVCGSCSMRVNQKEVLACAYKVQDGDTIEPLGNLKVVRDLVVDAAQALATLSHAKSYLSTPVNDITLSREDEQRTALQSDCILCGSCYSACPVYSVNTNFMGPFALTRVLRYLNDPREKNPKEQIEHIQSNGVWDCTLCDGCTLVCPQGISSKADIEKLRAKSALEGFMDPNFGAFGDFDSGFGFDGSPSF